MTKGYSLTIRTDDGSTMLEADVDHMHQAFQRLIDWSIDELDQDVCAVISGPNGFCTSQRLKASPDFSWIEKGKVNPKTLIGIEIAVADKTGSV